MRTFLEAATGFPTFLFTVPLVAAAGFWLLVAVGAAGSRTFDGDADLGALGLDGVPVAVAFSLGTGFAWAGSLGAVVLLQPPASSGPAHALTGLVVLVAAPSVSWCATDRWYGCCAASVPMNPGRPRRASPGRPARFVRSGRTAASSRATPRPRNSTRAVGPPEPQTPAPVPGGCPPEAPGSACAPSGPRHALPPDLSDSR